MRYLFLPRPAALLGCALLLALASGCAGQPQAPILRQPGGTAAAVHATADRLDALLPAGVDVLLLGEQHDAAEHQQIEQQVIALLSGRGLLAALALEMADTGHSTAALQPGASEEQTRHALGWNEKDWPWAAYAPAVMTAVRAGVPVVGANLPRAQLQTAMANSQLDAQLPGPALKAQQQQIRIGHCKLLPESQIAPMTRVQIARDLAMARAIGQLALPGKVVVLLAGSGHVDRQLGVPLHLPASLKTRSVRLRPAETAGLGQADAFDSIWPTASLPDADPCAALGKRLAPKP